MSAKCNESQVSNKRQDGRSTQLLTAIVSYNFRLKQTANEFIIRFARAATSANLAVLQIMTKLFLRIVLTHIFS